MAAGMLAADAAAWRVDAARRSDELVDVVRSTIGEGLRAELLQGALAPLEDRIAALEGAVSASDAAIADGIDRATRTLRRSLEVRARPRGNCLFLNDKMRGRSTGLPDPARRPQESETALLAGVAAEVVPPLRAMCVQMLNAAAASVPADRALPGPVKAEISDAQLEEVIRAVGREVRIAAEAAEEARAAVPEEDGERGEAAARAMRIEAEQWAALGRRLQRIEEVMAAVRQAQAVEQAASEPAPSEAALAGMLPAVARLEEALANLSADLAVSRPRFGFRLCSQRFAPVTPRVKLAHVALSSFPQSRGRRRRGREGSARGRTMRQRRRLRRRGS